ncbi:Rha family transcriptional regulator [Aeromonas hydrophila NJ-35]|uniref:Rha family transcriptional regulator n=1 Tax=Aeromonas hydrophila TaxID=644 RepID=UPI000655CBC7|nr:Rha family transcriptional regulator [Aeromonas hydrophila]AKJ34198.1 Rha family transcriptional regulator [Aeromonas hydrophila NJ-35]HDK8695944.1 Rha family transcriptional regulator [Aeromonas hydrophila]
MTTLTQSQEAQFRELVIAQHGEVFTTSRKISELFGKRHADVLRAISCLECSASFNERNFALVEYRDGKGEARPEYLITKDGMVFLVMGFTGKQAARFKELYILAFNWMAELIRTTHELTSWQHDFTRREAVSVANGTLHGQGLARRRFEKHALSHEQAAIHAKLQMCLNLTGEVAA